MIWRVGGLAPRLGRVHRTGLRTHGDENVTEPGIPIYRRATDDESDRDAMRIQQDAVDAVDAFKRHTSEESRDLLAAGRDDEDAD